MNDTLAFLGFVNAPLALMGLATTPLELIGFVLALITVLLNIRQCHWAWLFSIISSATYALVFYESRLYGDMGLQLVFIAVSVWGWYQWLFAGAGNAATEPLPVTRLSLRGWGWSAGAWLAGFVILSWFLKTWTDTDVPHADGFLTAGSLLGQLLLSRKKLENWHVWIVVDLLYVGLYLYKNLTLTALLYAVFVAMAVIGLLAWKKAAPAAPDAMVLK
ncbi:nicotinamide riboside transporter PnuC [Janthinobacterium agaricidamnosum]|uniref:Nicotinamide riboside transporter PnuC n=1 Tax=Janthinobacterium agaricidamnosum NBRC 102515 = DSM 9628 TaxID=1349767 RepID=W0V9E7_9BURK|nr:nicotinamide riboside transporter PnuC [Janthinobacterium agaricidamnosum]CDG83912.1 nicotinamide mononucleotide transporter PnuC family protein [Janthinobacterium agaricidamnosum NBRC 102515 = DSM 9628]